MGSSVGSESAPHFYKSPFGSWVRALMEAKKKGQLGPAVTVPMSGLPLEGYPEGSRRVWTP